MSVQTQIDRISVAVQSALAAITEKGVTVPDGTKVDGLAALIAAIESGGGSGGIDISYFEGMGFEEGSFTHAADTYMYNGLVQTSFTQCYGGFVFAETMSAVSSSYFILGFYLATPNETGDKRRCMHMNSNGVYRGSNSALDGYYPANNIYITDSQSRMKYQAGKTYKWVAWGV